MNFGEQLQQGYQRKLREDSDRLKNANVRQKEIRRNNRRRYEEAYKAYCHYEETYVVPVVYQAVIDMLKKHTQFGVQKYRYIFQIYKNISDEVISNFYRDNYPDGAELESGYKFGLTDSGFKILRKQLKKDGLYISRDIIEAPPTSYYTYGNPFCPALDMATYVFLHPIEMTQQFWIHIYPRWKRGKLWRMLRKIKSIL